MRPRKRPTDILPDYPRDAAYSTERGLVVRGLAEQVLPRPQFNPIRGRVQLVFTSPPFPLNRKKKYGNLQGEEYLRWLSGFGPLLKDMLAEDGSIVIELGNSWEPGMPVMSTLGIRALLQFQEENDLHLCQEFICHNPARLPSPAQWVTVERIRLKDSYTRLWWLSTTPRPKAQNRRVLTEYSSSMERLLRTKRFNAGKRPSEHAISQNYFGVDHGGAIPPSVLSISNTRSNDEYQLYCRANEIALHPARMPIDLPDFFIRFLTDPGDIVLDPFGGSNTTGAAAERLDRRWVVVEPNDDYIRGSMGRFSPELLHVNKARHASALLDT